MRPKERLAPFLTFLYFLGQVLSDALCSSRELREGEGQAQSFPPQEHEEKPVF